MGARRAELRLQGGQDRPALLRHQARDPSCGRQGRQGREKDIGRDRETWRSWRVKQQRRGRTCWDDEEVRSAGDIALKFGRCKY